MKERPIIFNAEMVRAILDGRKTQTRRIVANVQPDNCLTLRKPTKTKGGMHTHVLDAPKHDLCPFGQPGDRLWVRETSGLAVRRDAMGGSGEFRVYRASNPGAVYCTTADGGSIPIKWIPSIHMPRKACRILLEITDVRVELLNAISNQDAMAEGIGHLYNYDESKGVARDASQRFSELWKSIYGEESWQSNPWVWVIEFKRVEGGAE